MSTARILLVEDDPVSRELIAALLSSRGMEVDVADDGFGALRLAQEKSYDLVFVDYHLPEMDGYALARLMRSLNEKSDAQPRMVAITADEFGLSARRGVDAIFDRVLTKPIDPDILFTFVDAFLGTNASLDAFDAALGGPGVATDRGRDADVFWRARELSATPSALVLPMPTSAERGSLDRCFELTDSEDADCIVVSRPAGLVTLEVLRAKGIRYLQPLIVIDPRMASLADVHFDVAQTESWTRVADAIKVFGSRAERLAPGVASIADFDLRVLAYMFVANRPLVFLRDSAGATVVPYTAGFAAAGVIDAVKRLAARGLVAAKLDIPEAGCERRLVVTLTAKGLDFIATDHEDGMSIAS